MREFIIHKMGWDLNIAVEVFDEKKGRWITLSIPELREGQVREFLKENLLPRLIAEVKKELPREEDEDEGEWQAEIEGEAMGHLTNYFTISIGRNYDLFDYVASVIQNKAKRIVPISGMRGPPLDSSTNYDYFPYSIVSFLTLSELRLIDWSKRIDRPMDINVRHLVYNAKDNANGSRHTILLKEWEEAIKQSRTLFYGITSSLQ